MLELATLNPTTEELLGRQFVLPAFVHGRASVRNQLKQDQIIGRRSHAVQMPPRCGAAEGGEGGALTVILTLGAARS